MRRKALTQDGTWTNYGAPYKTCQSVSVKSTNDRTSYEYQ